MELASHAWLARGHLPLTGSRSLGVLTAWFFLLASPPEHAGPLVVEAQTYKCHPDCERCHLFDYDQSWHCVLCKPGFELWVDGCFRPCGEGNYRYGYECQQCTYNCKECVGPDRHECTVCQDGYEFDFRGVCVRICGEGFHPSLDGRTCQSCNAYCKTCLAGYRISCLSCLDGYTFRVINENTSSGECMQNCPVGYYRDASNDMRCIQCGEYCDECDDIYRCQRCWDNATLSRGLCYLEPDFIAEAAIDFETYMRSGQGMVIDIEHPSKPDYERMYGSGRRLREQEPAPERTGSGASSGSGASTCKDGGDAASSCGAVP